MFRRQRRLLLDALLLGIIGALSAQLFLLMLRATQAFFMSWIAGYQGPGLPEEGGVLQQIVGPHGLWLIPVITTLGGLISGILVFSLAPEAEGHGTDAAVSAFHRAGGFIRARVAPLKMVSSALTIGSGGAAGREGPTALISAGIGSIYCSLTQRGDEDRRLLVLIGMSAGLSAIFRSPIGTAFFAIEVLYSDMEFDAGALLYTMIASIVAYAFNGLFVGWEPLFHVPGDLGVSGFLDYGWYVVLGLVAGVIATLLPAVFYGIRDAFQRLPGPAHVRPAIGGLGVGLLALALPQVLGGGYGWIQEAIDGQLTTGLMLALIFAKILALSLTVSSGGSGGIFAPSLFVGAMLGGFLAQVTHQPSAALVVVGMAAVFGGAARVPIANLLMVTEMTGGFELLVPAALAVMLSYLVQVALSHRLKYQTLYEAQVPGRADSPAHHVEHLEVALRLLRERRILAPTTVGHLDLKAVLVSGVPVDLPDGKQLVMGTLSRTSDWIDQLIRSDWPPGNGDELEIVAIFRQGRTILPNCDPAEKFRAGDQALVLASPQAQAGVSRQFTQPTASAARPVPTTAKGGLHAKPSNT